MKAARDFGAPIRFMRGVSLEPDTVRDFAAEQKIAIGTSFDEVLADRAVKAVVLATPHTKHPAQVKAAGRGRQAHLLRKAVRAEQGRSRGHAGCLQARRRRDRASAIISG